MRKRHVLVTTRGISSKRNQQQEESAARVPYASAGLCTCWYLMYRLVVDDVATEEDQQQLRNLFTVIHFRSDIEVLLQLQEKIIDDVDRIFNSFSLKKLANLKIDESYFDNEALILSWVETDSTRVALNGRMYILTKYRELLIRRFLEARKINFVPVEGSSATDLKVLEMLSDLHRFVVEDLKEQTIAHGLRWEKTCCSKIFEGRPRDRGAVIARTNTNTRSTCWIRTMICVDGVLVIEPCGDHWVKIPQRVVNNEISRQRSYDDTLPPVSAFFKLMKKRWGDVCIEVAQFFVSDLEATRKEVKDIKSALSKDFDEKLADIHNELLEFRVDTQGQLASLAAALNHHLTIKADPTGEVVEVAIEQMNRAVLLEVVLGKASQRRGDSSGSSKRRRSSGESPVRGIRYGPYPPVEFYFSREHIQTLGISFRNVFSLWDSVVVISDAIIHVLACFLTNNKTTSFGLIDTAAFDLALEFRRWFNCYKDLVGVIYSVITVTYSISDELFIFFKKGKAILTIREFRHKRQIDSNAIIYSKWKESMVEIEIVHMPGIKETTSVLRINGGD
ncbi:hypothetical protein F511_25225 [Dorcoceras hygrometricum]|uniref:Uncharacterized protein n=1 Tax=Dorcoceras hygrometricum TaxID=472368 RepID=A0A2Z7AFW8_9LAMI|nr:hypothetical protein F511_25225 [Dorcoceras hygrometricum]